MAPADDFTRSLRAMHTSFLLSNMAPQRPRLNRGRWKQVETAVRGLAASHGSIWIFTGPVFAGGRPTRTIGRDQVAVPSHFFKVVLCVHSDDTKEMFAFVLPNTSRLASEIAHYAQTVNFVERLTGLNFFAALPDSEQNRLEQALNPLPQ